VSTFQNNTFVFQSGSIVRKLSNLKKKIRLIHFFGIKRAFSTFANIVTFYLNFQNHKLFWNWLTLGQQVMVFNFMLINTFYFLFLIFIYFSAKSLSFFILAIKFKKNKGPSVIPFILHPPITHISDSRRRNQSPKGHVRSQLIFTHHARNASCAGRDKLLNAQSVSGQTLIT